MSSAFGRPAVPEGILFAERMSQPVAGNCAAMRRPQLITERRLFPFCSWFHIFVKPANVSRIGLVNLPVHRGARSTQMRFAKCSLLLIHFLLDVQIFSFLYRALRTAKAREHSSEGSLPDGCECVESSHACFISSTPSTEIEAPS